MNSSQLVCIKLSNFPLLGSFLSGLILIAGTFPHNVYSGKHLNSAVLYDMVNICSLTVDLHVPCLHGSNLIPSSPICEDVVTKMSQKHYFNTYRDK